jgi:hypothetical protein
MDGSFYKPPDIPAGALPTPMKAKRFNGLESQLSIFTVLSPLLEKQKTLL